MPEMDPDPGLDGFLGGRWGTPQQGIVAPMWVRHLGVNTTVSAPLDVKVVNDCAEPVLTEACSVQPPLPVETALAQLGIIKDPVTGEPIARVMVSRVTDETTGVVTETITAYYEDGTVVPNYTGPWSIEGDCLISAPSGILPTWG